MATEYDQGFYDTIRAGTQASAAVVVPIVMAQQIVEQGRMRVVDVGCGEGWWADEFAGHGCDVVGVDGAYVRGSPLGDRFVAAELLHPLPETLGRFDLAVCLEVGEHLPASRAHGLVADLCRLAPVVLWSAAIPGQGGTGHINEQWPAYWVEKFAGHGMAASGALRWQIWEDRRMENWYCAPDDAEILTSDGWKFREQLAVDESVLTYNMADGSVGWEPVLAINTFYYAGPLIELAGRWRTTPDHRWPVFTQWDNSRCNGPRIKLTQEVGLTDRLIQCGVSYRAPAESVLDARDAAVLGWIVTDGSFLIKPSNSRPQAVIYQSPKKYLDEIVELLGDEGGRPREDTRASSHGCVTVGVRVSLLDRLIAAGFQNKYDLPAIVTKLGPAAVDAMWDAMLKAEGSNHGASFVFHQLAGPVFDAFQILSLLRGNRVNRVGVKHSVGGTGKGFKSGKTVAAQESRTVGYEGPVWCPTTPSGTWVMRQNGAAVVTGNCQNLLVFAAHPERFPALFDTPLATPWPVVHPVLYNARR